MQQDLFETDNIVLAAALDLKFGLHKMTKSLFPKKYPDQPAKYIFVFLNTEELQDSVLQFDSYELKVEPRAFHSEMRKLKSLVMIEAQKELRT